MPSTEGQIQAKLSCSDETGLRLPFATGLLVLAGLVVLTTPCGSSGKVLWWTVLDLRKFPRFGIPLLFNIYFPQTSLQNYKTTSFIRTIFYQSLHSLLATTSHSLLFNQGIQTIHINTASILEHAPSYIPLRRYSDGFYTITHYVSCSERQEPRPTWKQQYCQ